MTAKEIRELTGMTRAKFCQTYGIPVRSMENWESGTNNAPGYVLNLLERAVRADIEKNTQDYPAS